MIPEVADEQGSDYSDGSEVTEHNEIEPVRLEKNNISIFIDILFTEFSADIIVTMQCGL